MDSKKVLMIAAIAVIAVAVVSRIPQAKALVYGS